MKLLAIDACTEALSVAVHADGAIHSRFDITPRRHAELCLPWCDELLAQAGIAKRDLQAVAVTRGPGAFTGVRLGLSIAQGIALALELPLLAHSSLEVLAMHAKRLQGFDVGKHTVLVVMDARMGELYAATYRFDAQGLPTRIGDERLLQADALTGLHDGPYAVIGTGLASPVWRERLISLLGDRFDPLLSDAAALPHAQDLVALALAAHARGEAIDPQQAEPAYLRDKVAETLEERGKR